MAWCIATFILLYYSRFFKELIDSPKKNDLFYEIFIISFFINLFLSIFVSLILPACGYKNDEEFSPYLVFIGKNHKMALNNKKGSGCLVLSILSIIVALFPIYGFWILLMIPVISLGFLMSSHLIPCKGTLNTIILYLLYIIIGCFFYFIEEL